MAAKRCRITKITADHPSKRQQTIAKVPLHTIERSASYKVASNCHKHSACIFDGRLAMDRRSSPASYCMFHRFIPAPAAGRTTINLQALHNKSSDDKLLGALGRRWPEFRYNCTKRLEIVKRQSGEGRLSAHEINLDP